jgi:hypothetical protein
METDGRNVKLTWKTLENVEFVVLRRLEGGGSLCGGEILMNSAAAHIKFNRRG